LTHEQGYGKPGPAFACRLEQEDKTKAWGMRMGAYNDCTPGPMKGPGGGVKRTDARISEPSRWGKDSRSEKLFPW